MKFRHYIGWAACTLMLAACQDDMLEGQLQQQGNYIYTLSGRMDGDGVMSRAQIQLGNEDVDNEHFFWNNGDCFSLYQTTEDGTRESVFQISDTYNEAGDGEKHSADFSTTTPALTGFKYVATYPSGLMDEESGNLVFEIQKHLDFTNATTDEAKVKVWSEYLQRNMFMMATGELKAGTSNTVRFEHLCSMLRVTYTNETEDVQSLDDICFNGNSNAFRLYYRGFYSFKGGEDGTGLYRNNVFSTWHHIKTTGLKVAPHSSTDFYVLLMPHAFPEDAELNIRFNRDSENEKSVWMPVSKIAMANNGVNAFEAGKRYWFRVTELNNGLEWEKDVVTIQNPGLTAALKDMYPDEVTITDEGATFTRTFAESLKELVIENEPENGNEGGEEVKRYSITTLEGIENFSNLLHLVCVNTGLQNCDVSKNSKIKTVCVNQNDLQQLDFSMNSELSTLLCSNNPNLRSVNVKDCELLKVINVDKTALTTLEVYNPSQIIDLGYSYTGISLDLSKFTGLRFLSCRGKNLQTLNLDPKAKEQISTLDCAENKLTELNLKEYPALTTLYCGRNSLSKLTPAYALKLSIIYCENNMLQALDVSMLTNLQRLMCGDQKSTLTLTLNEAQKSMWSSKWCNWYANGNVKLAGSGSDVERVTKEVTTWKELATAAQNPSITDIVLTAPVVADAGVSLQGKILSLSENFNFGESKAAIMFIGDYGLYNGTFKASSSDDTKYMISSKVGLHLSDNFELVAEDNLNGIYVEDNGCAIYDNTSITVAKGHAFKAVSNNAKVFLQMDANATINGNVFLEANNPSIDNNNIHLMGDDESGYGRINGNVTITSVPNAAVVYVHMAKEGLITGSVKGGKVMVENPGQGGGNQGGGNNQGGNTNGNDFWFKEF